MQRVATNRNPATDLFGAGRHGFTAGAPGVAPATVPGYEWYNATQEEIARAIEGAGIELDPAEHDQLLTAIKTLAWGNGDRRVASQAEAEAGEDNGFQMTALRVAQAIAVRVKQATEAVLGVAKVATQTLVDAGTDDTTIVTPKKLRWGFSISKGTNGYISLPSWLGGLIFQWGLTGVVPDDAEITVTFPIAFPNACLNVSSTCQYPAIVSGAHVLYIDTVSTTNFVIGADDVTTTTNASLKAYWLAIGH